MRARRLRLVLYALLTLQILYAVRTLNLTSLSNASFDVFVREMHGNSLTILSCLTTSLRVPMFELTSPAHRRQAGSSLIRTCVCVRIRFNIDGGKNKAYDLQQIRPWQ